MASSGSENKVLPHSFSLKDRKQIEMSGVLSVISFDESTVLLRTSAGKMQICGKDLHVTDLRVDDGHISIDGQVDHISYHKNLSGRKYLSVFR